MGTCRNPESSFRHTLQPSPQEGSWSTWTHPSVQSIFQKRTTKSLPPWTEAFSLVSEFFSHEHQAFSCFHPPAFMALLGQQYSGSPPESPAWWASLNAVLAIAQRRRVEKAQEPSADEDLAWCYAANALGTTLDVLMRNTQLLSVQALLSIAWFFIGTPNPQPAFMLIGSALRLAHSIGLHMTNYDSSWGAIEYGMRRRVFWIATSLDRELCLRTGRPPAHDLHDFHVDAPSDPLDDSEMITTTAGSRLNLFQAQVQLAVVQGCIYRLLHSSEPSATDTGRITDSVARLNQQLDEWWAKFAPVFHPAQALQDLEHHGLLRSYYSYYNCVIVVNRAHGRQYWTPLNHPATPVDLSTGVRASIQRCLKAARSIVALNHAIPRKWKSFYW
ncbi:hypothetical protein A1O3_02723 [Capronia epimyces CBS 606.96]|uniref:Xylanolytic transcriptional activator regulatory domain-containing protein n=1 Tax=Capronia epimyces CBS 606.96 TaxID=1182542 RepID=W9YK84_9EURO|nr:uncharacterized protein A1O3_02723 [Capronia epimyces CBS 606.96]EXJ89656.1 hypothetical protein A1O3_02723 [Capronia epimyces CBS 606.96]